ncbi:hypothetical protein [Legionella maioricensis]|uniref:Uncharacterized protein n=1 Tax=Legionella maioricensis TaxID=2896528 RepID=A0A9X2D2T0_9GAMM|nr:hypothetical protein [Legionella maioricensis]MCL9685509.1 hypothetical protein [Legionella maioricensis]MCL9688877.1 hypothetical protein [Legionella maioricensis]
MSGANSAKTLLSQYNSKQHRLFTLNDDEELSLTVISSVPGVGASQRKDIYRKKISHPDSDQHVKFITRNGEAHSFVWQTNPQQLKNAVRWGIIKTHSITSKVISALGNYRVVAHERIAKGMISNSQTVKLKLLDLYQDRFEALHDLESMVNKVNSLADYESEFKSYIQKLEHIKANLSTDFADVLNQGGLDLKTIEHIKKDLETDIDRANSYLDLLRNNPNLSSYNEARGKNSILEFVKSQMMHGLYELQGINQDLTYSTKRSFALTRGEFNDFIEDARKEIDDQQADMRNAVTEKHHGLFTKEGETLVSYDFSKDGLSPKREREVLLAISFIEGWDKVDTKSLTVSNQSGSESLDVISATRWKNHRNFIAFAKSMGFYVLNFFKSIILPTKTWEEEAWSNKNFHLVAKTLRENVTPNEPMWQKPIRLVKQFGYALVDLYNGIRDFGAELTIKLPEDMLNDWDSCNELVPLKEVFEGSENEIATIKATEEERLKEILRRCNIDSSAEIPSKQTSRLATVEYALTAGEQNDILTVMARGLNEFASVFSHNLYAKDPVGGLVFTAAFAVGAGAIYLPTATASVFGSAYVNWFTQFSYSVGSSKMAAVISGGSTQAQLFATGWDGLMHGPSGLATNALYQLGEDPLTVGAYLATATAIGYVLVNGIAGYSIPLLSDFLKEDLGTSPESSYPFIGAKVAILLYEALIIHKEEHFQQPELLAELIAKAHSLKSDVPAEQKVIDRFILASWISMNAENIPKLNAKLKFDLSRQINALFDEDQSKSLNKILYPESHHSIAYQIFAIPLSYIPAVLRFATSFLLSAFALGSGKSHPVEPIKRASIDLYDKITRDLSRLLVFSTHLLYLAYTGLSVLVKPLAYVLGMMFGRVAALFDVKPGHAMHGAFAGVHTFFRSVGEFLYPNQILKSITVAHPSHTVNETDGSYKKLLTQMGEVKPVSTEESPQCTNPEHFTVSFTVSNGAKASNDPVSGAEIVEPEVSRLQN